VNRVIGFFKSNFSAPAKPHSRSIILQGSVGFGLETIISDLINSDMFKEFMTLLAENSKSLCSLVAFSVSTDSIIKVTHGIFNSICLIPFDIVIEIELDNIVKSIFENYTYRPNFNSILAEKSTHSIYNILKDLDTATISNLNQNILKDLDTSTLSYLNHKLSSIATQFGGGGGGGNGPHKNFTGVNPMDT